MTPIEAKALTLEVWTYLAAHPSINCKLDVPEGLFDRIKNLSSLCPLCELYAKMDVVRVLLIIDGFIVILV